MRNPVIRSWLWFKRRCLNPSEPEKPQLKAETDLESRIPNWLRHCKTPATVHWVMAWLRWDALEVAAGDSVPTKLSFQTMSSIVLRLAQNRHHHRQKQHGQHRYLRASNQRRCLHSSSLGTREADDPLELYLIHVAEFFLQHLRRACEHLGRGCRCAQLTLARETASVWRDCTFDVVQPSGNGYGRQGSQLGVLVARQAPPIHLTGHQYLLFCVAWLHRTMAHPLLRRHRRPRLGHKGEPVSVHSVARNAYVMDRPSKSGPQWMWPLFREVFRQLLRCYGHLVYAHWDFLDTLDGDWGYWTSYLWVLGILWGLVGPRQSTGTAILKRLHRHRPYRYQSDMVDVETLTQLSGLVESCLFDKSTFEPALH